MEWGEEENQNLKEFFHLFGRWRVSMAHEHRDRQRSSIPFPFNKLPVARSLGGSSHCFIHNEKERLLDTIWEADNGISSKAGKEEEEISGLWRRRICRSFHAFSRRPFGAMIIRAPLAVNVAKKGIIARRAGRDF